MGSHGRPRARGMTLVETLIASSVMLMLFVAVLAIFTVAGQVQDSVQNAADVQQRALASLEAMAIDLANSRVISPTNNMTATQITAQFPTSVSVDGMPYVMLDASRAVQFDTTHPVSYSLQGTTLVRSWTDSAPRVRMLADLGPSGALRIYVHDLHYAQISITSSIAPSAGKPRPAPYVAQTTVYLMNQ